HRAGPATISVAVEDPTGNNAIGFGGGTITTDHDLPDLTARAAFSLGGASVEVSGVIGENHVDGHSTATNPAGFSDSETGYGLAAGVEVPFGDMFTLYGNVTYVDGMGRYMTAGPTNVHEDFGPSINNIEAWGGSVGASFKFSEASSINGQY